MLDIPVMGVNAPKEHQRVIRRLTTALDNLYISGEVKYEPFPETMVDESKTSATPDVLLYDNVTETNIVTIEITIPVSEKDDFKKTGELCEKYNIEEGFTYNYRTHNWRKYKLGIGEVTESPSFCDSIGYDLNNFLK